eukprot:4086756-Lingulodinium_polyedra.AAC.1
MARPTARGTCPKEPRATLRATPKRKRPTPTLANARGNALQRNRRRAPASPATMATALDSNNAGAP